MEKKKFLQSEYSKLFGLPYVNQSDIVMAGKFLNISTVYRDKTGTIVLDPFKQAANITNKISQKIKASNQAGFNFLCTRI